MKPLKLLLLLCTLCSLCFAADPAPDHKAEVARLRTLIENLHYRTGQITVQGGIATINLPDTYRYLDQHDAGVILSDLWRNPRDSSILGLIVPATFNPASRDAWAVVVTYDDDGYVKDNDASTINYDKLLKQMKEGVEEASKERVKQGYQSIQLVGWAEPPRYDQSSHKLYWAKELRFNNETPDTLNYNIRMLGRHGVLVLNAVAGMDQLQDVKKATPDLLAMVNFQEGHRYADFNPSTDKIATYGLAALVLGGIAAKAGFFKLLLVGILAFKKIIIFALVAVSGFFKKLFGRKTSAFAADTTSTPPPTVEPAKDETKV